MSKVILILSDALRYDAAVAGMGYLGHLVEVKRASLYKVVGELPSMSRPMYETTHTGLPTNEHKVVSNYVVRLSTQPNIFQLAVKAGKTTAAAAYYWFSELYNRAPFDPIDDREVDDPSMPIQHGRFYMRDEYPDGVFLTFAIAMGEFTFASLLVWPAFGPYLELLGAQKAYTPQALSVVSFALTWLSIGLIQRIARGAPGQVAGAR